MKYSYPVLGVAPRLPLFLFLALFFWLFSAFVPSERLPSRAENSEMMQMRGFMTDYAHNFMGLRYRYGGVLPQTGFDCSGFTSYLLKQFDIMASRSSAQQARQGVRVPLRDVIAGDLIFFGKGNAVSHVAMVVENTVEGVFVIHSTCSRGIMVENILESDYWMPKLLFARDLITPQWGQLAFD
jgi:hypothetical protein